MTGGSTWPRQELVTDNLFRHRIPFSSRHVGAAFKTTQVTRRSTHTTVPYSRLLYGVLACIPGVYDASTVECVLAVNAFNPPQLAGHNRQIDGWRRHIRPRVSFLRIRGNTAMTSRRGNTGQYLHPSPDIAQAALQADV